MHFYLALRETFSMRMNKDLRTTRPNVNLISVHLHYTMNPVRNALSTGKSNFILAVSQFQFDLL